jgi:predicted outer membrane repeat protein
MQNQFSRRTEGEAVNPLTHLRAALYLVVVVAVSTIPVALAQRKATSHGLPATTIVVTNTNDSGPGSLRNALSIANDGDTIDATGVSGTILLTSGELQINHNVTINGPGAGSLAVNGNAASRVFHVFAGLTALISGLTVTNGFASGPYPADEGAGIWNDHAVLTLSSCVVTGNSSAGNGGGIKNDAFNNGSATLEINNCTVSSNSALCAPGCPDGGGIYSVGGTAVAMVTITNSTISGNSAGFEGGGITNYGSMTVSNCTISGNSAGAYGGGVQNDGTLTLSDSIINDNSAGNASGGGIYNEYESGGTVMVTNCTISGNSATYGGGISNAPTTQLTVMNSTISGNSFTGDHAGGIDNGGNAAVINSTISGNFGPVNTGFGGGMVNGSSSLTVKDCTFSGNSCAGTGGAIFNWTGGTTQIGDTVLNAGASGGTLYNNSGTITSLGYNLASDNGGDFLTGPGDQINTDPVLGPLRNNGGHTFTHALLPGSPAIDAGDPNFTPPPFYDQRGPRFPRIVYGRIDIGSFEVQRKPPTLAPRPTPPPHLTPPPTPTGSPRPTPAPRP